MDGYNLQKEIQMNEKIKRRCIHENCPICNKKSRVLEKYKTYLSKIKEMKAIDYKIRCEKYLEWFRNRYF